MNGLATLIRLHRLKLTEQQKKLTDLQAVAHGYENEIGALDRKARQEAESADDHCDTAFTLGSFVQASRARQVALRTSLAEIEREMGIIRNRVAAAFRELKRYELIAERRAADEARSRRKLERNAEDEIGMSMFRNRRPQGGV